MQPTPLGAAQKTLAEAVNTIQRNDLPSGHDIAELIDLVMKVQIAQHAEVLTHLYLLKDQLAQAGAHFAPKKTNGGAVT